MGMIWTGICVDSIEEYSFLVGSDSHITFDPGRLSEMMQTGIENDDLFYCHLGDLADTKPEYYYNTEIAARMRKENGGINTLNLRY